MKKTKDNIKEAKPNKNSKVQSTKPVIAREVKDKNLLQIQIELWEDILKMQTNMNKLMLNKLTSLKKKNAKK